MDRGYRVSPIVLENKKTLTNVDSCTGWWTSMDNCDAMVVFFAYNVYEFEGHFNLLQLGEAKEEPVSYKSNHGPDTFLYPIW